MKLDLGLPSWNVAQVDDITLGRAYTTKVEQLDELSNDTLKSYKKKAIFDLKSSTSKLNAFEPELRSKNPAKDQKIAQKRVAGINAANRALNKEETELEEVFADQGSGSGNSKADKAIAAKLKAKNTRKLHKTSVDIGEYGTTPQHMAGKIRSLSGLVGAKHDGQEFHIFHMSASAEAANKAARKALSKSNSGYGYGGYCRTTEAKHGELEESNMYDAESLQEAKPKTIPMGAARHPAAAPGHPNHSQWLAAQPKRPSKAPAVRQGKPIETSDPKLHQALENHLGGQFAHFETDPRHSHTPEGHAQMHVRVRHSYSADDLGMHPDEFEDTDEAHSVKVIRKGGKYHVMHPSEKMYESTIMNMVLDKLNK
jgi:hypothetical protein